MNSPATATFFLSTGRCGTQWLAEVLSAAAGARARVEHEPLHNDYAPRRMLGAGDPAMLEPRQARKVAAHVAAIETELTRRDYIETGHPCWSSVPWLARRFAGRVRVVHLVRHPVATACSWVSHGAFVPPLLPHLPAKELISPTDAGVAFPGYRDRWPELSPFEKSLVYWAEVNAFALRAERSGPGPWLRLRYEDLFGAAPEARTRLAEFLGLPAAAAAAFDRSERVDAHRFGLDRWPEPERIARHPGIVALAAELGYQAESFSSDALAARFFGG